MSVFDIDYTKLVTYLLPTRLRGGKLKAFLLCLIAPVVYVYNMYKANRVINLYRLNHNSQVCFIAAILNDAFDATSRRITIGDVNYLDPVYTYTGAELKPVYLYTTAETQPIYLYTAAEISAVNYDFIVNVPAAVTFDSYRLKALIDAYRLPGMYNYQIIIT